LSSPTPQRREHGKRRLSQAAQLTGEEKNAEKNTEEEGCRKQHTFPQKEPVSKRRVTHQKEGPITSIKKKRT